MMKFLPKKLAVILILPQILLSCSMVRSTGVNIFADILSQAAPTIEEESSWEYFKDSIGPQLKLIESLASLDPNDERFLLTLIQGHTAYAFSVWETLYLKDFLLLKDHSKAKERANFHYSRAIFYGEKFLQENDLSLKKLIKSKEVKSELESEISNNFENRLTLLFLAQAVGGIITLNKDQSTYLTALPVVKGMFDWICEKDPRIYFGACPIFYAVYDSSRPRMLGGNPENGKSIFLKEIQNNPKNYLVRAAYLQYYVVPMSNEEAFNEQIPYFEELEKQNYNLRNWRPLSEEEGGRHNSRLNLMNATALERFKIMNELRSEIF